MQHIRQSEKIMVASEVRLVVLVAEILGSFCHIHGSFVFQLFQLDRLDVDEDARVQLVLYLHSVEIEHDGEQQKYSNRLDDDDHEALSWDCAAQLVSHLIILIIMIRPYRGTDGNQYAHNFKNTYLSDADLQKPSQEVSQQIATHTKKQLENIVFQKQCATMGQLRASDGAGQQYVKFTPKAQDQANGPQEKIVKVQSVQLDPLEPPRFKHKRIPKGPGSPPPIMMRSPPRKLTVKDQLDWKIPPCISNWKNAKGYTIPLEMRLSADGRTLQHHTVNAKFAQLTDGLYIAERQSRKELEERNRILKSMAYKEYQEKEEETRQRAMEVKKQKNLLLEHSVKQEDVKNEQEQAELQAREEHRYLRKRELERELRMQNMASKKSKQIRDAERDISEKIALGQAQPTIQNVVYDQRLFNQSEGVSQGFGDEDDCVAYDKPLFGEKRHVNLYTGVADIQVDDDDEEGENKLKKKAQPGRDMPVQFERSSEMFGMDLFLQDPVTKKVRKE